MSEQVTVLKILEGAWSGLNVMMEVAFS